MHFRILSLVTVSLSSITIASPLTDRQVAPGNSSINELIAKCAPYPFLIQQFTTFSGSDVSPPQISFFFTNENGLDADRAAGGQNAPILCSVTLPMYSDVMSDYAVWSCENGTGFRFDTNSTLTVSQSMTCDALWEGAPIWALADGSIDTTSQSGVDGGVYNTSIKMEIYLTPIEIVESIPINVPNLPTCGQMCVNAELNLGPSFSCSPSNYTCLCGSVPFATAYRNCLLGCPSPAETQESTDYWNTFCAEGGVQPAVPFPGISSSPDCGIGSEC